MPTGFTLTEDGQLIDINPFLSGGDSFLEYVDGSWVKPTRPVTGETLYNGRSLSKEEVESYIAKLGKSKAAQRR